MAQLRPGLAGPLGQWAGSEASGAGRLEGLFQALLQRKLLPLDALERATEHGLEKSGGFYSGGMRWRNPGEP